MGGLLSADSWILLLFPHNLAVSHNLTKVSDDAVSYTALALRERLLGLVKSSLHARDHRFSSTIDQPAAIYNDGITAMWDVLRKRNVGVQLEALKLVEADEEEQIRRERAQKKDGSGPNEDGASGSGAGGDGTGNGGADGDSAKKRKRGKEGGPGVIARGMTEDQRTALTNNHAIRALGGLGKPRFAWMAGGAGAAGAGAASAALTPAKAGMGAGGRPQSPLVLDRQALTLRDVEFAIDREKGHGGGRGSARGWS